MTSDGLGVLTLLCCIVLAAIGPAAKRRGRGGLGARLEMPRAMLEQRQRRE